MKVLNSVVCMWNETNKFTYSKLPEKKTKKKTNKQCWTSHQHIISGNKYLRWLKWIDVNILPCSSIFISPMTKFCRSSRHYSRSEVPSCVPNPVHQKTGEIHNPYTPDGVGWDSWNIFQLGLLEWWDYCPLPPPAPSHIYQSILHCHVFWVLAKHYLKVHKFKEIMTTYQKISLLGIKNSKFHQMSVTSMYYKSFTLRY